MRIMYAFVPHFECVTLINGAFNERPAALSYPSASPLYITLLPLRAMLLPYTVRLIGGKVASNAELARSFEAGADRYIITFDERHNYVYSPRTPVTHPPTDPAERFFRAVKSGDVGLARGMMTKELILRPTLMRTSARRTFSRRPRGGRKGSYSLSTAVCLPT